MSTISGALTVAEGCDLVLRILDPNNKGDWDITLGFITTRCPERLRPFVSQALDLLTEQGAVFLIGDVLHLRQN